MITTTFYAGRDNSHDIQLSDGGFVVHHSAITRVVLEFNGAIIDSLVQPELFTLGLDDRITLKFGLCAALTVGVPYLGNLIIFDASHSNGLVWSQIQVIRN